MGAFSVVAVVMIKGRGAALELKWTVINPGTEDQDGKIASRYQDHQRIQLLFPSTFPSLST